MLKFIITCQRAPFNIEFESTFVKSQEVDEGSRLKVDRINPFELLRAQVFTNFPFKVLANDQEHGINVTLYDVSNVLILGRHVGNAGNIICGVYRWRRCVIHKVQVELYILVYAYTLGGYY